MLILFEWKICKVTVCIINYIEITLRFHNIRFSHWKISRIETVVPRCYVKKVFFRNFTKFTGPFIKKEILAQVFFCEFCKISKNIFFYRLLPVVASEESVGVKFKEDIWGKLCLKLWFESDCYVSNITKSVWFSKRLGFLSPERKTWPI